MRCSRLGSVRGIFIHVFYPLICAGTNIFVALHSNEPLKRRHDSKIPVQSNILVGDKAARKTTKRSITSLFAQQQPPTSMRYTYSLLALASLSFFVVSCASNMKHDVPDYYRSMAVDSMLGLCDDDGNGAISAEEFYREGRRQGINPEQSRREFRKFDTNGDGNLTQAEIHTGVTLGPDPA